MQKIIYFIPLLFCFMCLTSACAATKSQSYEDCLSAGGKILKTNPPRCIDPEGQVFVRETSLGAMKPRLCKDTCGDGECAEMVCMAEGCPCAETPETCPQDCKKR